MNRLDTATIVAALEDVRQIRESQIRFERDFIAHIQADERTDREFRSQLLEHHTELNGNSHDGLKVIVQSLQQSEADRKRFQWLTVGAWITVAFKALWGTKP